MATAILEQELAPLNAQIELVRGRLRALDGELGATEADLATRAADRQRFDALREACNALDRLGELEAAALFWDGLPEVGDGAGHLQRLRGTIARFDDEIRGVLDRQAQLHAEMARWQDELDGLAGEVHDAYAREERRLDEFAIEREISAVPCRVPIMPWSGDAESERRLRRTMLATMIFSLLLGIVTHLVTVPVPERLPLSIQIPERLATLVKKEVPKPPPVPERVREAKTPTEAEKPANQAEPEKAKAEKAAAAKAEKAEPKAGAPGAAPAARKKAESTGILAFKSSFADLIEEVPVAKLGTEARLSKTTPDAPGQAQRSLVAMQAMGSSGGIGVAGVSRNIGGGGSGGQNGVGRSGSGRGGTGNGDGLGGVGVGRVDSPVAGLAAEARPLSSGAGPARTDEEIQIVFDRYKAALYRIYNTELRKNPTLRGKMLLRLTIEPGGEVSACAVESTDLASPELVAQIVERVKRFNFGPKEGVPKTTILYPIDFLPAG